MKTMVLAVMLATAGPAGAQEQVMPDDGAVHEDNLQSTEEGASNAEGDVPVTLSRKKRGVGPVVGMHCESGYKLVGEDCVLSNVAFE